MSSSSVTSLEERGLFWWHGGTIPEKKFAPDAAVLGLLSIGDDGMATLVLDGHMPSDKGASAGLSQDQNELKDKTIEGKLIDGGKCVLLLGLTRHGGSFRSNNLSQDGYRSTCCLISNVMFPALNKATLFRTLKIDLAGYEGWLRLGSIKSTRTESSISVQYNESNSVNFQMDEGALSIVYDILGPITGYHQDDHLSLKEKAFLVFRPQAPMTLDKMRQLFRSLEEARYDP